MMAGDIDYIPLEMVFSILLWLPVSSLLRFKCVCKCWLSHIQSPDFISQHFRFGANRQQTNLLLLSCPDDESTTQQHVSLLSIDHKSELLLDFPIPQDFPVELVASYNGLICLRQDHRVYFWNPATKQCTLLPPLPEPPSTCFLGFGADLKTDDYKLVYLNIGMGVPFTTHVYSLTSDSWRERDLEGSVLIDMCISSVLKTPYRGEIYCWIAELFDTADAVILFFDFSNEVFGTIPLPNHHKAQWPRALFTLRENIASVNRVGDNCEYQLEDSQRLQYEIWMLNDYDVNKSWSKLYTIKDFPISYFRWMTWFSKNGEFLLFLEPEQLRSYDIANQEVIRFPVQVSYGFELVMYEESLVSVKRGNDAANDIPSMDQNERMLINDSSLSDTNISQVIVMQEHLESIL